MKIEMPCGGTVEDEAMGGEGETVVCSKGCTHSTEEVVAATPLIVTLKCGGTVDLNKTSLESPEILCSKGCIHTGKEIVLAMRVPGDSAGRKGVVMGVCLVVVLVGAGAFMAGIEGPGFPLLGRSWTIPELLIIIGGLGFLFVMVAADESFSPGQGDENEESRP